MKLFKIFKTGKSNQTAEPNKKKAENDLMSNQQIMEAQNISDNVNTGLSDYPQEKDVTSYTEYDIKIISEIKDVKLLARIAIENNNFFVAKDTVRFINDDSALIEVIKGSKDSFVQRDAYDKLSDDGLITLAKESIGGGTFYRIYPEISKRIRNPLKFLESFMDIPRDDIWIDIVRDTKDQEILAKVATKLDYLTSRGYTILGEIKDPMALAYVFVNSAYENMKNEAFRKLESIKPEIIKDVKNGRYSIAEYFKVTKENVNPEADENVNKLRYQHDSFMYSEVIGSWEVLYTSDLYLELTKLNIKDYHKDCLLDGVILKPLNSSSYGQGIKYYADVVCPKCQEMFDYEDDIIGGLGGGIVKCTNCGFDFDIHFYLENGIYYLIAYTYVGKPYDINKVPKPSIYIYLIDNL